MKKMRPLVSICIPTYNAALYIEETLRSITEQTYKNVEIIVGDNASTDNTEEIVQKYRREYNREIIYYKNIENLGYAGNCNKLIELSKGEFVAIYHSDDIYSPDIIDKQVQYLLDNVDVMGCFTRSYLVNMSGAVMKNLNLDLFKFFVRRKSFYSYEDFIHSILEYNWNPFFCPSSMVRKTIYKRIGGYDIDLKYIEDQDMWIKILKLGKLAIINEKLVKHRVHPSQGSSIYSDTSRKSLNPMIEHISNHLKNKYSSRDYKIIYDEKIKRLSASDNIRLAYRVIGKESNENCQFKFNNFITKSKMQYKFKISDIRFYQFAVFQWIPSNILFRVLNLFK